MRISTCQFDRQFCFLPKIGALNSRLLTTIQAAVLLYKERIGHDPGVILLERGAYDVVTEATREVALIRGQNGKATVTLFGIPVERVLRPGYGFYISERCCVNPGGAEILDYEPPKEEMKSGSV